jgi:hypothetical protein
LTTARKKKKKTRFSFQGHDERKENMPEKLRVILCPQIDVLFDRWIFISQQQQKKKYFYQ